MRIVSATIADARRISALINGLSRSFLLTPSGEGAEPFLASVGESAIGGFVSANNFDYAMAEVDGQLAGVVAVRDHSHLFHLFVAEAFQRSGLGTRLWLMAKTRALQAGNAGRFTVNSSLNAIPVYRKFGFVETGPVVRSHGVAFQPMQWDT